MEDPTSVSSSLVGDMRTRFWLLVFFVVATALNLTKAFHIDDPYHVQAAQWIAAHPLQPMSGTINWTGWEQHFYDGNQPPLFFYGLSLWGSLFGFREIAMHGFEALFTGICIVQFHRLAVSFTKQHATWLTGLLALSPAFLVNQNVMVDIPLLACVLAFLHLLFAALHQLAVRKLFQAALVLTIGIFIKYTMLAVIPMLIFGAWRLGGRAWLAVLVPALALLAWSAWNHHEFGFVHLLGRSVSGYRNDGILDRVITYVMTLGAIAPWSFAGVLTHCPQWAQRAKWTVLVLWVGFVGSAWLGLVAPAVTDHVLLVAFLLNGALGIGAVMIPRRTMDTRSRDARRLLMAGIVALAVFIIVLAPWMATRHVLLVVPLILLLAAEHLVQLTKAVRYVLLGVTAVVGVALSLSDARVAAFYRDTATRIAKEYRERTIWYAGSMGWGHYAAQAGMKDLSSTGAPAFAPGDIIAQPLDFMVPDVPANVPIVPIDTLEQELDIRDRFSTRRWLRFYSAQYPELPWMIHEGLPERIRLSRVVR